MSTKKINNAIVVDAVTKRLQALKTHVASKAQIGMNGQKRKLADVVAIYQSSLDTRAALASKRTELQTALAAKGSAESARLEADKALEAWVVQEFGAGSQQALDFGFAPPKKAVLTVEEKAQAKARSKATRIARNTMGSQQKKLVKGTMVVLTAPAAPANSTLAGASPAGQPAVVVASATTPQQQTVNGAPAPATPANGAPAPH